MAFDSYSADQTVEFLTQEAQPYYTVPTRHYFTYALALRDKEHIKNLGGSLPLQLAAVWRRAIFLPCAPILGLRASAMALSYLGHKLNRDEHHLIEKAVSILNDFAYSKVPSQNPDDVLLIYISCHPWSTMDDQTYDRESRRAWYDMFPSQTYDPVKFESGWGRSRVTLARGPDGTLQIVQ